MFRISQSLTGWLILCALLATFGCACRRGGASSCPQAESAWCEQARRLACRIPADPHEVERNRALADAAVVALEVGSEKQARRIADEIEGWRRGDLLARLAARSYSLGQVEGGDRLADAAAEVSRERALEAWQVSRVKLALERARQARPGAARGEAAAVSRLEPADQAALLPELMQRAVAVSNLTETLVRLEAVTNSVMDLDAAAAAVDAYRVLYQKAGPDTRTADYRERVFVGMTGVFGSLHPALACDKLVGFGEAALACGDTNLVLRVCGEIDGRLGAVRADMRLPVQLRYARFLARAGERERSRRSLEEAGPLFDDPAVLAAERPALLATQGVAWKEWGDAARASACWRAACASLESLENARPRATAAVHMCLIFARARVEEAALDAALAAVCEGLGEPW